MMKKAVRIPMQTNSPGGEFASSSHRWVVLFVAILLWVALVLSVNIQRPWINALDYNGAVWSQSAHNILRARLAQTSGASSGFYFGPLPIPAWGYYLHHPPLLHLVITALFALFGEHEWVARLLPIGCSLVSVVLLWLLVRSCVGSRTATLSAAVFASLPMELRYGQMVNFEPCVLMFMLGALLCLRYWNFSGNAFWRYGALGVILAGLWVDWAMYIFVLSLCVCLLVRSSEGRRFARVLLIAAILSATVYLIRIRLLRPDAWENLTHALVVRLGSSGSDRFTEFQWIKSVLSSLLTHFLLLGWVLATAGAVITFRARHRDEGRLWLFRASV
jgi:4-amino-4-deoxy-L-arabinose transferase-like glycosyltransferase